MRLPFKNALINQLLIWVSFYIYLTTLKIVILTPRFARCLLCKSSTSKLIAEFTNLNLSVLDCLVCYQVTYRYVKKWHTSPAGIRALDIVLGHESPKCPKSSEALLPSKKNTKPPFHFARIAFGHRALLIFGSFYDLLWFFGCLLILIFLATIEDDDERD